MFLFPESESPSIEQKQSGVDMVHPILRETLPSDGLVPAQSVLGHIDSVLMTMPAIATCCVYALPSSRERWK